MSLPDLSNLLATAKNETSRLKGKSVNLPSDVKEELQKIFGVTIQGQFAESSGERTFSCALDRFLIGAKLVPLYDALLAYKEKISGIEAAEGNFKKWKEGEDLENLSHKINALGLEQNDAERLFKFISDTKSWAGGKNIKRGDFHVSPLLAASSLLATSANFLPEKIVPLLSRNTKMTEALNALADLMSEASRHSDEIDDIGEIVHHFQGDAADVALRSNAQLIRRFAASFLSKRFLISTGLAGSGKTKLAQAFAHWITPNDEDRDGTNPQYALVPVGADWTGNENILGYPNALEAGGYISKPALDVMLHAMAHADTPHFLILDEMNLSHVERYFADFLSLIESGEGLELYSGDMEQPATWRKTPASKSVPPKLKKLPDNLFIVGTVNVDETTYMFSPKVLDRANVIEFRMNAVELEAFLKNPAKPDLSQLDGKGAGFGRAFVEAARSPTSVPANVKVQYDAEMLLLFKALAGHGAEFGYRTAYETSRFVHFYKLLGQHADDDAKWFSSAFDCVILQKLLPKLHGSRARLGPVLRKLWFICVTNVQGRGEDALEAAGESKLEPSGDVPADAPYPMSAEKIARMWRLLSDNGFASFAEA